MNNTKDLNNRKEREVSVTRRIPRTGQLPPCALRDPVGARRARAPVSCLRTGVAHSYDAMRVLLVLEKITLANGCKMEWQNADWEADSFC